MEGSLDVPRGVADRALLHLLVVTAFLTSLLTGVATAQAQPSSPTNWKCEGVDFADVIPEDTHRNGAPVEMSVDGRGRWVPVVFVHGWTSSSTHVPEGDGAFTHPIDKTANHVGAVDVHRSLIGQLQTVPGVASFTFDYHEYSGRWVSDRNIGPALGDAIDCLFERSGREKVIVVAHSMGGLATRFALHEDSKRKDKVSTVLTFGTPNTGSVAALVAGATADAAARGSRVGAAVRAILAICGHMTTQSMTSGPCSGLPAFATAFDGEAGRALRTGSRELRELLTYPKGVAVHALYGDTRVRMLDTWFGIKKGTFDVPVGDVIVTDGSAKDGSTAADGVRCEYSLEPVSTATRHAAVGLQLQALNETPAPLTSSFGGACFHNNLMRSIELTNTATAVVDEDIVARLAGMPPTRITDLAAVYADGTPAEGFSVTGDVGPVDCSIQAFSPVAISDGIYKCSPSAASADVCWPEPGQGTLLCAYEPWGRDLRRAHPQEPLSPVTAPSGPHPWAMELATGAKCRIRNGGAWGGRSDGHVGVYSCDDDRFVFAYSDKDWLDDSSPVWTALVGDLGAGPTEEFPPPTVTAVVEVWRATNSAGPTKPTRTLPGPGG